MRVITWNCHASGSEKIDALLLAGPDIAVVPECSEREIDALRARGMSAFWVGNLHSKGLGVFAQNDWGLSPTPARTVKYRGVAAYTVSGPMPFTLMSLWTQPTKEYGSYVKQIHAALEEYGQIFEAGPVVVAGDFNTTSRGPKQGGALNHARLVEMLAARGLVSAYHTTADVAHGEELADTYYHQWNLDKGFHIDYVFVPKEWLVKTPKVLIGSHEQWGHLSDHLPVIVDLEV